MKTCHKCGKEKPLEDFNVNRSRKEGRSDTCRDCHGAYGKSHYERNKAYYVEKATRYNAKRAPAIRELVDSFRGHPCLDCKGSFPLCCMEFDHIDPSNKLYDVSTMIRSGFSVEIVLAEIAKCEVVCANCHRIRTETRRHNKQQRPRSLEDEARLSESRNTGSNPVGGTTRS